MLGSKSKIKYYYIVSMTLYANAKFDKYTLYFSKFIRFIKNNYSDTNVSNIYSITEVFKNDKHEQITSNRFLHEAFLHEWNNSCKMNGTIHAKKNLYKDGTVIRHTIA